MPVAPAPRYSACIELLFADGSPGFGDRIHRAAAAGFEAVEFWQWRNKNLTEIETALRKTGLSVSAIYAEPVASLTDPASHGAFLDGLKSSAAAAGRLGAPVLVAQAGDLRPRVPRREQHDAIIACLDRAADIADRAGITLALEPLNDRLDYPGHFLTSTTEGLDIVDAVGRPEIRLLYDIYHSAVMDEVTEAVIGKRIDRIAHVHLADFPGRHEPGSGGLDWRHRVDWLISAGYQGLIGLEYYPSGTALPVLPSARFD